jgi:hypothetical protein
MKSIGLQALSYALRLCTTTWLKGYIPVDSTGDWLYQLSDLAALALCLQLCYCIYLPYRESYEKEADSFPALYTCLACFALALVVHPDLNNRWLFDAIWTSSLYIDVVSMLPQLWMIGKIGGKVGAVSAHYVALVAVARSIDVVFWCYGFKELAPEAGGFNLAGWTVLLCHVAHLLLMADFIFCYVRAMWREGFFTRRGNMKSEIDFNLENGVGSMFDV